MNFDFISYIRPKLSECLNFVKFAVKVRSLFDDLRPNNNTFFRNYLFLYLPMGFTATRRNIVMTLSGLVGTACDFWNKNKQNTKLS
ncbi:MAG: hypothetical protein ACJAXM_000525 [Arenicella sp.]